MKQTEKEIPFQNPSFSEFHGNLFGYMSQMVDFLLLMLVYQS